MGTKGYQNGSVVAGGDSPVSTADGRKLAGNAEFDGVPQAQALLAAIVEASDDAIVSKNLDGIIQSWNGGAERLFGYTQEEAIGRSIELIIPSHLLDEERTIIERIRRGERIEHFETVRRAKDGSMIDISLTVSPVRDSSGRVVGASKVARNVTERKRDQEVLRESEQRLRLALEAGRMGTWEFDAVTGKVNWSESLERIHGIPPGSFLGTFEAYMSDVHPEDKERVENAISEAFKNGEGHHIEYRIVWPDGSIHWVEGRGTVVKDGSGKTTGITGVCADFTDRKETEVQLAKRAAEQTALFEFTDKLHRAGTLQEVFETALESILGALGCHRASILLFDESRVMRFVAWKGLSDNYRKSTEGHSPWDPDVKKPKPVCVENVELADFPEGLKRTVSDEGIGSLAFIPLVGSHRLIGKFMAYFDGPHKFDDSELDLALTIGRQLAYGIERMRAEESLRRERELLQTIIDRIPVMITVFDPEKRVMRLNAEFQRAVGWTVEELVGRSLSEECYPDPEYRETVGRFMESCEDGWMDIRMRKRDGRFLETSWANIKLSDHTQVGIGIDITERKRREGETRFLADSSASLADLVDYQTTLQKVASLAVPDFADWCTVDMVEADGTVSRLAVAHVDPTKVELAHDLYQRHPARPDQASGIWEVIKTGKPKVVSEITDAMVTEVVSDQETLAILRELGLHSYMCVPLLVRNQVKGVISFITAESGRKYDDRDLAVAEDLAHRAAIAIENAQLYHELRQADRRKDEFLAMLAHELRNPLAPISNAVEMINLTVGDDPMLCFAQQTLDRQVKHMVRLVDDLLDVSRITRDKLDLRKARVDLSSIVLQAVETARPIAEQNGSTIEILLPDEPIILEADLVRLTQVCSNLLNNGCKFTPAGGVVKVLIEREGDEAVITVSDNGIGIPPDKLDRIFDMFAQIDTTLNRSRGGLGIGLTLVKRLVELHGGSVSAFSAGFGQGSKFVVRLPLQSS